MSNNTDPETPSSDVPAVNPEQALVPAAENTLIEVPEGGNGSMSVNGVQVKRATEDLPPDQRDAIRWFHQYCVEHGWNTKVAGSKLRKPGERGGGYDRLTVYHILRGSYAGKVDNFVASITSFREIAEKRDMIGRPDFIETSLTQRIWDICNQALEYQRVALVFGDGQIGKTTAYEEFARRRNHGRTRYIRLPSEAPVRATTEMLAAACACQPSASTLVNRQNIIASFDSQTLLIVDELQQITLNRKATDRLVILELLREIFDRSGCGMVICGTNEALSEFHSGPNALWLRQLKRRSLPEILLEAVPLDEDMLAFAAHFGLGVDVPPDILEEMRRIGREVGVGQYITYLQGAAKMANAERKGIAWTHFSRSLKAMNKLGQVKRRAGSSGKEGR